MRWFIKPFEHYQCLIIFFYVITEVISALSDPYKLLGVSRSAQLPEIRRAYKQLAKEWHPDKTDDPSAESKFVEIKQAYEILSDPERRKLYDLHGITDEDSAKQRQDYSYYGRFSADPFEEFFGTQGRFHFQDQDITIFHKMTITTRQFENNLIPKSHHTPQLVMFYADWCFPCLQAAPLWRKLVDTLEPLGISLATLHAGREPTIAKKVGVSSLPNLVLILDGKYYVYKEQIGGSVQKITDFIRSKFPYKMIQTITETNIDNFLNGWSDNRVRSLIFEKRHQLRLRYLATAFHFRDRVTFGFVHLQSPETAAVQSRFKVSNELDTVLVFNENVQRAIASVSMIEIPSQTLHHVIAANQYLALPRLSSQAVLEALCPAEWNRPRKRLCVILVTSNTIAHDPARQALRQFASETTYASGRVRFVYLYHETQSEFINSLGRPEQPLLRIVIIWRRDTSHVKYEWLENEWQPVELHNAAAVSTANNINDTKQRLEETISRLLRSSEALNYEAIVKDLMDEHTLGMFSRIIAGLLMAADVAYENLTREHLLPALSVVATVLFIVGVGYFMAHLVRLEEESIQQKRNAKRNGDNNNGQDSEEAQRPQPRELYLHELRAEKYNGLVRLLKPGCRTVVLFVDAQSRLQLIPAFHTIVWPYRKHGYLYNKLIWYGRNKTLMFAHMSLERGLSWYRELLQLSLPEPRELNINPRNCVGTVLSLNGHRKYFCMFHAKHAEIKTAKTTKNKRTKNAEDPELGAFIGFESDTSDSDADEEILLQGTLLDALPNWLDRLFEGTTRRYYINYWPDFPTK